MTSTTITAGVSDAIYTGPSIAPLIGGNQGTYTLAENFTLYVPFTNTIPGLVNVSSLVGRLDPQTTAITPVPVYSAVDGTFDSASITASLVNVSTGVVIWVPVTSNLSTQVEVRTLIAVLSALPFEPSNTPPGVSSAISSQVTDASTSAQSVASGDTSGTTTSTRQTSISSSILITSVGSNSATGTSPTASTLTSSQNLASTSTPAIGATVPETTFKGAIAGGVIGGLIIGVLIGALIWGLCFRGRSGPMAATTPSTRDPRDRKPLPTVVAKEKGAREAEGAAVAPGWRKHLPQEKDDHAIIRDFKSLFVQIQLHVEGFYGSEAGKVSKRTVGPIERLAPGQLPGLLLHTKDAVPILEAILARWIVQRISLRSNAQESLLPIEFASIPEQNKWHMETDGRENGLAAESRDGFSQAFAEWRVLTGFLLPNPASIRDGTVGLEANIARAASSLTQALAPWELPGKSNADRTESLRGILQLASKAGILLFTQPSTFMFEWSSRAGAQGNSLVVTPALLRRLDSSGKPLRSAQVLIEPRVSSI
ncbi:hypothetical protein LTR91_003796 [Friedmanniomyces endolithicus]|uniref:Uncharacterized protein n=1 Tax=Friedmanniomyces endolithicus TaxID=329885 RepID=A0AAN6QZF6_9PEZI|nr:hypothetical protein LTR35_016981 [Friedmanniomyces endolithicus]KAK0271714.1 hypothetical protein LTS00_016495 [Friedmanniomyces endolithicus]KAK0305431.1 hypothetical protein LTR82_016801 [Friedmanniomyces endolithicus]KAK0975892.1 hypothetical protein LTR54_016669 [Friedmanniomyces endolithicus]KAK0986380.1 hypothetical protein LTS01_009905 [Friedmanniomyces endolithicus]